VCKSNFQKKFSNFLSKWQIKLTIFCMIGEFIFQSFRLLKHFTNNNNKESVTNFSSSNNVMLKLFEWDIVFSLLHPSPRLTRLGRRIYAHRYNTDIFSISAISIDEFDSLDYKTISHRRLVMLGKSLLKFLRFTHIQILLSTSIMAILLVGYHILQFNYIVYHSSFGPITVISQFSLCKKTGLILLVSTDLDKITPRC